MAAFGKLLVEIRKSVGNKWTDLDEVDLLQAIGVTDAEEVIRGATLEELRDLLAGESED